MKALSPAHFLLSTRQDAQEAPSPLVSSPSTVLGTQWCPRLEIHWSLAAVSRLWTEGPWHCQPVFTPYKNIHCKKIPKSLLLFTNNISKLSIQGLTHQSNCSKELLLVDQLAGGGKGCLPGKRDQPSVPQLRETTYCVNIETQIIHFYFTHLLVVCYTHPQLKKDLSHFILIFN